MVNFLLRRLQLPRGKKISEKRMERMFKIMARKKDFYLLIPFLNQCAEEYRDKYIYTEDRMFKGMVLAFTLFRDRIKEFKAGAVAEKAKQEKKWGKKKGNVDKTNASRRSILY